MGKEKGFALSSIRARDMRRYVEHHGYRVVPGQHKHLKLKHDTYRGTAAAPTRRQPESCGGQTDRGGHGADARRPAAPGQVRDMSLIRSPLAVLPLAASA